MTDTRFTRPTFNFHFEVIQRFDHFKNIREAIPQKIYTFSKFIDFYVY